MDETKTVEGTPAPPAVEVIAAPDLIQPRCPHCGADPLKIWRLRYDFPDGVVAELLFCGGNPTTKNDCRAVINATIVGFQQPKKPL